MSEDQLHAAASQQLSQGGELIRVLAAVIRDGDRYLVCLRPAHKRHGGCWEFPGGKLEAGETLLEAATRELGEELGIEVLSAGESVFTRHDPGSSFLIEFVEVSINGNPVAREHDEIRWVTPAELEGLHLAPSDKAFSLSIFR
jgi:8-oxo-dGTP diphosphatase